MPVEIGPDTVQNLAIWRNGMEAVKAIYILTRQWPREELYCLTAQVRRAAISIPANLAEGVERRSAKEAGRFAQIALGSAYELDTLLQLALELGFSSSEAILPLREQLTAIEKRISRFITYQGTRHL